MTDEQGFQQPILICFEKAESDDCQVIYGDDCTARFVEEMESLAVDSDGDDRRVIVVFHNLKGYDGMFLLQYLYSNHREVSRIVTVGIKVMSFSSHRLCFKDSLFFSIFSCFISIHVWTD